MKRKTSKGERNKTPTETSDANEKSIAHQPMPSQFPSRVSPRALLYFIC